jgi:hypothetical protein
MYKRKLLGVGIQPGNKENDPVWIPEPEPAVLQSGERTPLSLQSSSHILAHSYRAVKRSSDRRKKKAILKGLSHETDFINVEEIDRCWP